MGGDASAYAALGLEPGADSAAVERAYKRLIKQHHPDRDGGDARRAAEINRAYRELRAPSIKNALELHEHPDERRRRSGWSLVALLLAGAVATLLFVMGPAQQWWPADSPRAPIGETAAAARVDAMDQPLNRSAIDNAVHDALQTARTRDEMALAAASQACHHRLRTRPSLVELDRCAAFDDAVVQLQDRDPLRDRGPFSELAVTGRQWSAASALSNDYLAIDSRLDRIRIRVETALAPAMASGR